MARNTALPVLENVLIEATWQGVRLTATDLDLAASAFIGGKIEKPGRITAPFKALETLAKILPNEPLEMCTKRHGHLTLTQDSKNIVLETIDTQEFPLTPTAKGKTYKSLDDLLDGCKFVEHALDKDYSSRPGLTYAEIKKGKLWAADGFRLAVAPAFNGQGSLPRALVCFLARAKDEPTKLTMEDKHITVWFPWTLAGLGQGGDNWVSAQQYEGTFPDWGQVIPKTKWTITVDFAQFLDKVQLIAKLQPAGKMLKLRPKKGRLYLKAQAEELSIADWLPASCEGKADLFALNVDYLLATLHARKSFIKEASLKMKGGTGSQAITLIDQETKFLEVVMPMHIHD